MINTYARVIGAVRQQSDIKTILIYKIQPVKSINEVNTHYLEVINARYQAEEYYRGGGFAGNTNGNVKMEVDGGFGDAGTQGGPTKGKNSAIFNAIRSSGTDQPETGISKQELQRKFPHIQPSEMTKILDEMSADGHIYSTIDSDHFLSCF
jgi:replication factor A2